MKIQKKSNIILCLAGLAMLSLTSCNRGYGCPYDFSALKTGINHLTGIVEFVVAFF
ncbi:MAG: hypothetical protein IPI45_04225 [Saprospiraceae bacterium]|nr:hypothetical protein [Saprospiraceae bacterium]MBK7736968.1 hypothetical protein [Saprospiraceae bacterium]MBK7914438.1 hypothetical protein [Saprospiraceae bacterium]